VPGREAGGAIASWLLVAHTAGNLSAPCVRLLAPRTGAQLITQPAQVRVSVGLSKSWLTENSVGLL
jgi:hypothetical protein